MSLSLCPQSTRAKQLYVRWSTPQVPTVNMWILQISVLIPLEKLTHDLNHKSDTFLQDLGIIALLPTETLIHHLSVEDE